MWQKFGFGGDERRGNLGKVQVEGKMDQCVVE